jgi:glycosyltransferase involved in cell wall biosynthesis
MKSRHGPIYINGRFLSQPVTGVQRVAIELMAAFERIRGSQLTYLTPPGAVCVSGRPAQAVGRCSGHPWEQLELPRHARKGVLVNLCNTAPILLKNQVVVIHDTGAFSAPQGYSWRFRTWYWFLQRALIRSGVRIATVSQFSRSEIIRQLGAQLDQVMVIGAGADHMQRIEADPGILYEHGLVPGRFVLAVGSLAPHKNLTALVELARVLIARDMTMVITGGFNLNVFRNSSLPQPAKYTGHVSDAGLKALYGSAACFVLPSRYEGFGLPAIEAMSCGCPVAVSDIPALRETCGDGVIYFNPEYPDDIARKVSHILDDPNISHRLRRMGVSQSAKHTWSHSASLLDKLIAEVSSRMG